MSNETTLNELIDKSGMKKKAIAERMKISDTQLWRLLKDPSKLTVQQVTDLANAIDEQPQVVLEAIGK